MGKFTEIWMVRHGEIDANKNKIVPEDHLPLVSVVGSSEAAETCVIDFCTGIVVHSESVHQKGTHKSAVGDAEYLFAGVFFDYLGNKS